MWSVSGSRGKRNAEGPLVLGLFVLAGGRHDCYLEAGLLAVCRPGSAARSETMTISGSAAELLARASPREPGVPADARSGAVSEQIMAGPDRYFVNQLSFDRTGAVAWSSWEGYLKMPPGAELQGLLADSQISLASAHMPGHAPAFDLRRLAEALRPKRVAPTHSDAGDRFCGLFPRAERHADGHWWQVRSR
jgi:hypothetical protein